MIVLSEDKIARISAGSVVACAWFRHYGGSAVDAHVTTEPGGVSLDWMSLVAHYVFVQLEVDKLVVWVRDGEQTDTLTRLGFTKEGSVSDMYGDEPANIMTTTNKNELVRRLVKRVPNEANRVWVTVAS